MSIYDALVTEVEQGKSFHIDLKKKTLKIGKKVMIDNGQYDGELIGDLPCNPWEMAERLFYNYYVSMPSQWAERKKSYFKAKEYEDMNEFELAAGEPRLIAQAKLEGFILCTILAKLLTWNDLFGSWFWKSAKYPQFVLLKEWF